MDSFNHAVVFLANLCLWGADELPNTTLHAVTHATKLPKPHAARSAFAQGDPAFRLTVTIVFRLQSALFTKRGSRFANDLSQFDDFSCAIPLTV